jgi:hypothetical protein
MAIFCSSSGARRTKISGYEWCHGEGAEEFAKLNNSRAKRKGRGKVLFGSLRQATRDEGTPTN